MRTRHCFLQYLSLTILTLALGACEDDGTLPSQPGVAPDAVYFVRDAEFTEERIFDLFLPGQAGPNDRVTYLALYYEDDLVRNAQAWPCSLFVDPSQPGDHPAYHRYQAMAPYPADKFTYVNDLIRGLHYAVFSERHSRYRALGAYMIVDRYDQHDFYLRTDTLGDLSTGIFRLKMLSAGQAMEPTHPVWPLTWRNCYRIPKGLAIEDLDLAVCRAPIGQEDSSALDYRQLSPDSLDEGAFVTITGLDQFDESGQKIPDGRLDGRETIYRPDWGLLIFPSRHPFASDTTFVDAGGAHSAPLRARVPDLYETTSMTVRFQASQYYLRLTVRSH